MLLCRHPRGLRKRQEKGKSKRVNYAYEVCEIAVKQRGTEMARAMPREKKGLKTKQKSEGGTRVAKEGKRERARERCSDVYHRHPWACLLCRE